MLDSTIMSAIITTLGGLVIAWFTYWLKMPKNIKTDIIDNEQSNSNTILYYPKIKNGGIFINRFIINASLERGSFSNIYLVSDITSKNHEQFILKLFKYKEQPKFIMKYIENETSIANQFKQKIKGIANYHEVQWLPNNEGVLIIQDYINSTNLHDYIIHNKFTEKNTLLIAIEICNTLDIIHKRNIAHCDLKPKNILIPIHNELKPIIIDFGIAKYFGESFRKEEAMISVPYSAPEITNTSPIDARTDIYSLGVIILVMIVGLPNEQINKIQHYNESTIAITNTLKEQNIDREEYIKESIKKIINEQLKRTLLKCLTNNINERFKNITELKKALITIHEKLEN